MYKTSQHIYDICYECNPQSYDMTLSKFAGQENTVEVVGNPDYSFAEYLYECCECGTKVWVDDNWVKRNAVEIDEKIKGDGNEMKIKQQYFEVVELINWHREDIEKMRKEYDEIFIYEPKAYTILEKIGHRKNAINHLEEMMEGIREEVGRLTVMKWRQEYLKKGVGSEMKKCTFCGREDKQNTKIVGGYEILESCTDCEVEILDDE